MDMFYNSRFSAQVNKCGESLQVNTNSETYDTRLVSFPVLTLCQANNVLAPKLVHALPAPRYKKSLWLC